MVLSLKNGKAKNFRKTRFIYFSLFVHTMDKVN